MMNILTSSVVLFLAAHAANAAPVHDVHVCCGCGAAGADGLSAATAVDTLNEGMAVLRAARAASGAARGAARVLVSGTCAGPVVFSREDGGRDEETRVTVAGSALITGGVEVHASWLEPVTDASVLARLPVAARGNVLQLRLAPRGIAGGSLPCRAYAGGSGCILPANLRGSGVAELHWLGDPSQGGGASPLTLARWPNAPVPRSGHPHTLSWSHGAGDALRATVSADAAARLPAWAGELAAGANATVHLINELGWADSHNVITAIDVAGKALELLACPSSYPPYAASGDSISSGGTFTINNLLAELDLPGEYVLANETLYVWPPDAAYWRMTPWGATAVDGVLAQHHTLTRVSPSDDPVVAFLSVNTSAVLSVLGASFLSFDSIAVGNGRGAGIVVEDSSSISFSNVSISNVGAMGFNVTGGSNVSFSSGRVLHAGNGGAFLYGGNRTTLTPSGHSVTDTSLAYSSRFLFYYAPLVALGGVGNALMGGEVFGAPQMGVYFSGNDHSVRGVELHELVQSCKDCGAIYSGRDFTYQGVMINNNTFARLATPDGPDISAVYLDDQLSGITITHNAFVNISGRALLVGGGRDNTFAENTMQRVGGDDALVHFDARGGGGSGCVKAGSTLAEGLAAVPFATSPVWLARFPSLSRILTDDPCDARHNAFAMNTFCDVSVPFIDASNTTITARDSTAWDNGEVPAPCV